MGYQVPKHQNKRGWKVLHVSYKDGKRIYRGVPIEEYALLGIREGMLREEVIKALAPKNAQEELARHENRRNKIADRLKSDKLRYASFLPLDLLAEFESKKLDLTRPKLRSYWKKAQEIMLGVGLEPKDWHDCAGRVYGEFIKHQMSPNYVRQILPLLNEWGHFIANKFDGRYRDLPKMRGRWHAGVSEAFYNKPHTAGNRKSAPLTPALLESKKSELTPEQYRWLALSVWFGLRPSEVDLLKKPSGDRTWWVTDHEGTPVLWIYQTKLKGKRPEDRSKNIPAFLEGQRSALRYVHEPITRPSRKVIKSRFGVSITLYGGRIGFSELMRQNGQDFEVVSQWLGHTSPTRTYNHYFDKKAVRWKVVA